MMISSKHKLSRCNHPKVIGVSIRISADHIDRLVVLNILGFK